MVLGCAYNWPITHVGKVNQMSSMPGHEPHLTPEPAYDPFAPIEPGEFDFGNPPDQGPSIGPDDGRGIPVPSGEGGDEERDRGDDPENFRPDRHFERFEEPPAEAAL
jgi:hypothetical protein